MRGLNEIRIENKLAAEFELNKPKVKSGDWPEDHGEAVKPITQAELDKEREVSGRGYRRSTIS